MRRSNNEPVYYISVAARLLSTHPQTLRMYERFGLIDPKRRGQVRLFSEADIERIRRIQHLTQDLGVNLAGVEVVFKLLDEMDRMRRDMTEEISQMRTQMRQEIEGMLRDLGVDTNWAEAGPASETPRPSEQAGRANAHANAQRRQAIRIPVQDGEV